MRHRSLRQSAFLALLGLIIGLGFMITTLASHFASREAIRSGIIGVELPLTADIISAEIERDLVRLVQVSSAMAQDAFVLDWLAQGEQNEKVMSRYLQDINRIYNTSTAFFASSRSQRYYTERATLHMHPSEPSHRWFYNFAERDTAWEVVVDTRRMMMFINNRATNDRGEFVGVAGVGVSLDQMLSLVDDYQRRYERNIYFIDAERRVVLTGEKGGPENATRGTRIDDIQALDELIRVLPQLRTGSFQYQSRGNQHFINIRYIPELNWFLMVDKQESEIMAPMWRALWINLVISAGITAIVVGSVSMISRSYSRRIEALATRDALTGLLNRRGFSLVAEQALLETRRHQGCLSALVLDLDHFKGFNDTYGHLGGDALLHSFAALLTRTVRRSDIVSRWGGEEFVVLLKDGDIHAAAALAESIRAATEAENFEHDGTIFHATVSIGIAQLQSGDSIDLLLRNADRALYRAKNLGRNQVSSIAK